MITQDIPRIRASYADALQSAPHHHEGKAAKLNAAGEIELATSAADALGIISEPDALVTAQAGNKTGATIVAKSFGGIIEVQLGSTTGSIAIGTRLKIKSDGTWAAAASGEAAAAIATQSVATQTAGQLVQAILFTTPATA